MSYKINGVTLLTQPTAGGWVVRDSLGIDGNGHAIYPSLREFEMVWDYIDLDMSHQLQDFYDTVSNTGTISVDLPKFNAGWDGSIVLVSGSSSVYLFETYSGCVLREPEFGQYFEYHRGDVKLLIVRIKTV
jgi:hypothetical protein